MAHILEDRILESTTTTGTGDITLAGAVTGFRAFSAVCAIGDTVPYFIEAVDGLGQPTGDYEYGTGTYSAANTLTRTTVRGSSNAGAAVNFAAGSKNVGIALNKHEFAASIGGDGYMRLPGGFLMQWGSATTDASGVATINFPVAFKTGASAYSFTCATVSTIVRPTAGTATTQGIESRSSTTGALVAGASVSWFAVGKAADADL